MKQQYESEILNKLMERDGFNIPSSVPPYEAEIKAYLINQVKQAYPKLTDYEAEWLLYNYTKHLPADFPISSVTNVTNATFENVVPFAYQSAILKGNTGYRDIDTGEFLETFEEGRNLELVSVKLPVLTTIGKNLIDGTGDYFGLTGTHGASGTNIITGDGTLKRYSYIVRCKPNTTYTLTTAGSANRCSLGEFSEYPKVGSNGTKWGNISTSGTLTITTKPSSYYLLCYCYYNETSHSQSEMDEIVRRLEVQLEESSSSTSYEPYKTNILNASEDVELRGIGDVKDTLDCLTGEVVSNFSTYRFSDTDNWSTNTETNAQRFILNVSPLPIGAKYSSVVCILNDKLTGVKWNQSWNTVNTIACNNSLIAVHLPLGTTIEQCKEFMRGSIAIYRTEESIKTVDLTTVNEKGESTYFMPIEGTMHVSCSSETIQPTFDMSVPVEATTQNLASFIDMEME